MDLASKRLESICVFCGSSDAADADFVTDAAAVGDALARAKLRLVYGGGGVGLMGACARGAKLAGGEVLGVIPQFLTGRERPLADVETIVVDSMHERKQIMFERSDGFVVLPGGVGTLEEVVELLSWRRLGLHVKPVIFHNPKDYWRPLFDLFRHTVEQKLTPPEFMAAWAAVSRVAEIIPALERHAQIGPETDAVALRLT